MMGSVNVIREYALQVIALLQKKLARHRPEKTSMPSSERRCRERIGMM